MGSQRVRHNGVTSTFCLSCVQSVYFALKMETFSPTGKDSLHPMLNHSHFQSVDIFEILKLIDFRTLIFTAILFSHL